MRAEIKLAFASGTDDLNRRLIARMREIFPELPLWVVSDFPPEDPDLHWIPYRPGRSFAENWARCRAALKHNRVRLSAALLVPNVPFRRMRALALLTSPTGFIAFNENLNDFMLRPRCLPVILTHVAWRAKNLLRWSVREARRADWPALFWYAAARAAALVRLPVRARRSISREAYEPGISVVIPSRNGRSLLEERLPAITRDLEGVPSEIIVVDNGSDDGTAEWLRSEWPAVRVDMTAAPLSFARAVNRGIRLATYAHICLLNNDMSIEPGFFAALREPFAEVRELFSATARIVFPPGVRREETGKTVMAQTGADDFPVRCDEPLPGEDLSYVLYGSGGCTLYSAAKLRALGGVDEAFEPAYVEDLDLGYRAWKRGWPSIYAAGAVVEHRHRATTSRYFSEQELEAALEINYLRFLARSVSDGRLFRSLWAEAAARLRRKARHNPAARRALACAAGIARLSRHEVAAAGSERLTLALTGGDVAVFPGKPASRKPRVLIASPYLPFPLAHGGAVRMYNLMRRAADEFDLVLVAFTEDAAPPAPELLAICVETVLVRLAGSHDLPFRGRPDVVEQFASEPFRAALRQTVRKWNPAFVQLEFTQMAQYAADCAPAATVLVEHDLTYDLYQQLSLAEGDDWELRRQASLWRSFETQAWREMDVVVTMSEQDAAAVSGSRAVILPNGVDLDRFQPSGRAPEPRKLLFIGSFAYLPNLIALDFFLREAWPGLKDVTLHVIAGARHEYHMERYRKRVDLVLPSHGVCVEGFVPDVRPAYEAATLVISPLVASAGTNIKVMEAMAMGKAVVSTPAGVSGLDLRPGEDFILTRSGAEMAAAIENLLSDPAARSAIETAARKRVESEYGWDAIARKQAQLYRSLLRR